MTIGSTVCSASIVMLAILGTGCRTSPRPPDAATSTSERSTTTLAVVTTIAPTTTTRTLVTGTTATVAGELVPADMLNPAVTPETIATTICLPGYTGTVRPPSSITDMLKIHQVATYGYADLSPTDYEEDHAIALELGGAPSAPANLWPQPHTSSSGDNSLENALHAMVCAGRLDLATAQAQLLAAKVAHGYRREASLA